MSAPARLQRCRDCGAWVLWARSESGKRIPVDPGPRSRGELLLVTTELGKLLALTSRPLRERRRDGFSRQTCHGYGYDGLGERHSGRYVAHRASCHTPRTGGTDAADEHR